MRQACLVIATVLALIQATSAFHFNLPVGQPQCFVFEAGTDLTTVTVTYMLRFLDMDNQQVSCSVTDPLKKLVVQPEITNMELSHFSFQTSVSGRYDICFVKTGQGNAQMELDIDSQLNQDYRDPTVPVAEYELPLADLMPVIYQSKNEIDILNARQDRFEITAVSTYRRVVFFTLVNLACGIGAALWQVWNLRRFFKQKKIV
jgi:hypothetical protein